MKNYKTKTILMEGSHYLPNSAKKDQLLSVGYAIDVCTVKV